MDYYKLLQLEREPFSNSPDPDFFFQSKQHLGCIQELELALRLKRGLNVVIGDVGTGKTTLCRELIRKFAPETEFETHLILDPAIGTAEEFLRLLHDMLCDPPDADDLSQTEIKEAIKQALFRKGVDENRNVVLIIDEGQKISAACVEILRELLNYETNAYKLLQIVIFAQQEFESLLELHPNFADRVNLLHRLEPLNFSDTRHLIYHRLKKSTSSPKPASLFTLPALWTIYRFSKGYPRRIIHLCHQSVLAMIIQNRKRAGWALTRSCKSRLAPAGRHAGRALALGSLVLVIALALTAILPKESSHEIESFPTRLFKVPAPEFQNSLASIAPAQNTVQPNMSQSPPMPVLEEKTPAEPARSEPSPSSPDTAFVTPEESSSTAPEEKAPQLIKEPTPDASEATLAAVPEPPTILGKLKVQQDDTLSKMVYLVYGGFRNLYLGAVIDANLYIRDPNTIEPGDRVAFPAMPFYLKSGLLSHWIVLTKHDTLESAFHNAKDIQSKYRVPMRLIALWKTDGGLKFQVAVRGYFAHQQHAQTYLETLPGPVAEKAQIVSEWPAQASFFSDPYGGGLQNPTLGEAIK